MDGVGPTYERIRHRSFAQFLQQLQLVSDTSAFGINYVVNDSTVDQLDEAAMLAFRSGATELLLLPEFSNRGLLQSTHETLSEWLLVNSGRHRLAIAETAITDGMPIADPFTTEKGTKAYVHVNASGKVSRTSYEQDDAITIQSDAGILSAIAEYDGESA